MERRCYFGDIARVWGFASAEQVLTALNVLARPFAGPPGIPPDRMNVLQDAFEKAFADPALLNIVKKSGVPIDYVGGAEALKLIKDMLQVDPELRKIVRDAYGIK